MTVNVPLPLETPEQCTAAAIFAPGAVLDKLGTVKALIAKLEVEEKMLADALKATGLDSFAGTFFDATVSRSNRETLDTKTLYADLGKDMFADYVKSTPVVTLKLTAKK